MKNGIDPLVPSETTFGKLPEASNLVVYDSSLSKKILPNQPPLIFQQSSEPISLPPPTETHILEPVKETPTILKLSYNNNYNRFHKHRFLHNYFLHPFHLHLFPLPPLKIQQ